MSMICSIMQPSYLPWAGFFNLISRSDIFVFLDDAQFQKNSWHNRNRILLNGSPHWISVPVKQGKLANKINETNIVETQPWRKKHSRQLQQTYNKHPFAKDIFGLSVILEEEPESSLAELNIHLITHLLKILKISTPVVFSSQMGITGERTTRLIDLLEELNADTYLSPIGAMEYLEKDNFSTRTTINLEYQKFEPAVYSQFKNDGFVSHLSIVDVIANLGLESSSKYIL